jgi:hypothetical protein
MRPKATWALVLGILILSGCGPRRYAILQGTSHPNPPLEPLRVLVMPFGKGAFGPTLPSDEAVMAVHGKLVDELGREKVEIVEDVAAGPGSLRPMRQVRRVSNPFRLVYLSAEDSVLVSDLRLGPDGSFERDDLEMLRSLDVADLVVFGLVGEVLLSGRGYWPGQVTDPTRYIDAPLLRADVLVIDVPTGSSLLRTSGQALFYEREEDRGRIDTPAVIVREILAAMTSTRTRGE